METRVKLIFSSIVGGGWGGAIFFSFPPSYFASLSSDKNFHDPRTNPSGRKVFVGGGGLTVVVVVGGWFQGKFSVSFGPKPGFRL